jgi:hypothetical protein
LGEIGGRKGGKKLDDHRWKGKMNNERSEWKDGKEEWDDQRNKMKNNWMKGRMAH